MTTSQQQPGGRHSAAAPHGADSSATIRVAPAFVPAQAGPRGPRQGRHGHPHMPVPHTTPAPRYGADPVPGSPYGVQHPPIRTPHVAPQYGRGPVDDAPFAAQPAYAQVPVQMHTTWSHAPDVVAGAVHGSAPSVASPSAPPPAATPPAPPAGGPVPAKKRRKWPFVVAAIAILILVIAISNGGTTPASTATAPVAQAPVPAAVPAPQAPAASSGKDMITYEISGAGEAGNITYIKDQNMGQEQVNGTSLPWSKTVEFDSGMFSVQPLSLVAQSGSGGSGEISCRILRNGQELTSSTSSGPYAVVTCSAS